MERYPNFALGIDTQLLFGSFLGILARNVGVGNWNEQGGMEGWIREERSCFYLYIKLKNRNKEINCNNIQLRIVPWSWAFQRTDFWVLSCSEVYGR